MDSLEQLTQNIQILLEQYQMLQKENFSLREGVNTLRQEVVRTHSELKDLQDRCRTLATANAIAGDPKTRQAAYRRLSHIISQIDKAIATLAADN